MVTFIFPAIAFVWPVNQSRNATDLLETSRSTTLIWSQTLLNLFSSSLKLRQNKSVVYIAEVFCGESCKSDRGSNMLLNGTAHFFAFLLIIEGATEKVLQFIMQVKSICNKKTWFH